LPAEGVYGYRTTGGDSISLGGASHQYPSETFATVRRTGGCRWTARNDVIKEHVDTRTFCGEPGHLFQLSQRRDVEFFGQRDGMELTCSPPQVLHATGEAPGAVVDSTCSDGQGETARTERTLVGTERLVVGGTAVDVVHLKMHSAFNGRATGMADDELWVSAVNGLTVRWVRSVDTLADSSFGAKVRYQEQASFDLESLTPRT
jgi:hypothetical protein